MENLDAIMAKLAAQEKLEKKHNDHKLIGNFKGRRECHIEPDWLLIYKIEDDMILFERTGSHNERQHRAGQRSPEHDAKQAKGHGQRHENIVFAIKRFMIGPQNNSHQRN